MLLFYIYVFCQYYIIFARNYLCPRNSHFVPGFCNCLGKINWLKFRGIVRFKKNSRNTPEFSMVPKEWENIHVLNISLINITMVSSVLMQTFKIPSINLSLIY